MECLILTVSSDIIFEQQVCSTQIVYTNALSLGINTCKKINTPNLVSAHQEKSSGWLEWQQCGLHCFFWLFWTLFGVATKLKESIFNNNNQINPIVTTRTWVLPIKRIQTWPSTGLDSEGKNGSDSCLFEWQMFFFRVRGYRIVLIYYIVSSGFLRRPF